MARLPVVLVLLHMISAAAASESYVIETLPGYPGLLPFKLETGYIGVGEDEDLQLFYYFIESEGDPDKDPLILWMNGGPGCSGFTGLVYEIGPLNFNLSSYDGSLPSFILNPYSWTKISSIIFIDSPVGTGFSYTNSPEGYYRSDTKLSMDNHMFLRKWLLNHPSFLKNRLYMAGDSYGGKIATAVAFEIAKGNEAGLQPWMNLKVYIVTIFWPWFPGLIISTLTSGTLEQGYMIGNAFTDADMDVNYRVAYAHRMAIISDDLAKSSCNNEYVNPDPNNLQCSYALRLVKECTQKICTDHILEPKCKLSSPRPDDTKWGEAFIEEFPEEHLFQSRHEESSWCRFSFFFLIMYEAFNMDKQSCWLQFKNYLPSYTWARDDSVQEALGIRKGTKEEEWVRCNRSSAYTFDVRSVLEYHKLLNEKGYQILAYNGDHDMGVPYISTLNWIRRLNLTIEDAWRPWRVDGQIAGYTEKYKEGGGSFITFATGAGHTAPEYRPKQCFAMVKRWLSMFPL
ncbi:serine carboxypeptidase [Dorcoceras hygrometricum]|uniref:Serine carboxypeptidase n=1 Tax=Dorcoceras hygrometricum TaxID=472368 RepID=A0A2Z7BU19_9LAMI|nr:serine carboxypeptidase [Dorcoceras hygrometricum]